MWSSFEQEHLFESCQMCRRFEQGFQVVMVAQEIIFGEEAWRKSALQQVV